MESNSYSANDSDVVHELKRWPTVLDKQQTVVHTHLNSSPINVRTVQTVESKRRCCVLSPIVRFRLGLDTNTSKIDKLALCRRLDKSYETSGNTKSIIKKDVSLSFSSTTAAAAAAAVNSSAPLSVLSQSPLSRPSQPISLISTRRKRDNGQKRNSFKLKRRLALSSSPLSLIKRRIANMDKIRVDGANGLRFSARKKGAFTPNNGSPFSGAFVTSASESLLRIPKTDINPNKAVFTIDSKTSRILIVNNNACQLLGYTPRELCDMQFATLLTNKSSKSYVSALAEGQLNSEDGTMVLLSGKVVEMNTKCATKVAVSLWIRQIDAIDGRCLAVAEPVERRVAQINIDRNGAIVSGDAEALLLFQIDAEEQLNGMDVQQLIPAIQLPDANSSIISKNVRKQKATGKTQDGISFPLCLMITAVSQDSSNSSASTMDSSDSGLSHLNASYTITIWVFQNISGLLVIDDSGSIELCNHHFSMLMFGYSQAKMTRLHITRLLPSFGEEFQYLGYSRSRNVTASSLDDNDDSETETDPVYYEADQSVYGTPAGMVMSASFTTRHSVADSSKSTNEVEKSIYGTPMSASEISKDRSACDVDVKGKPESASSMTSPRNKVVIPKSTSESHLRCGENFENDQNAANRRYSHVESNSLFTSHSVSTQETQPKPMDEAVNGDSNDLLTPVNETGLLPSDYLVSGNSEIVSQSYRTADISEALREMNSSADTSKDNSFIRQASSVTSPLTNPPAPITSTPDTGRPTNFLPSNASVLKIHYNDGKYKGEAIHCDGNVIDILYTISSQDLPCGRKVYCVWICRDETEYDEEDVDEDDSKHPNLTLTFNSINSTIETSNSGHPAKYSMNASAVGGSGIAGAGAANASSRPNSVSLLSQCEDEQISGDYSKHYTTLKQIGKGAFGYVKMAFRHTDRMLVITKFILKEKLTPQFMVITDEKKEIPMEVYLLTTVQHPNIVTVLDVYENEKFFQLVMEKHGSGMDLFDFIDRRPAMDEQLGCYIFRQIVNAVHYLHSLNILHRDIKDENIIIDQYFHVKLIDFGSATFMEEGKLFSTFYGTTEYCSPEVLAGNAYQGPELEIWSLGVTLFVLIFFENPFLDIEETLQAELNLPHAVSAALENVLFSMLDKNPKTRCTMNELLKDEWISQEINSSAFNFTWIVPCENFESNPEKYFTGQVYSSTTGLSTTSPQDTLSLADEDSMIDADDDIECEELLNDSSVSIKHEFDYRKCRKSSEAGHHKDIIESLLPSTSTAVAGTPSASSSNAGKTLQLPIVASTCKNSDATSNKFTVNATNSSQLQIQNTKRSHQMSSVASSVKSTNPSPTVHHQSDAPSKISSSSPPQQSHFASTNQCTMKHVNNSRSKCGADASAESTERPRKICATTTPSATPQSNCTMEKESLSCDSISKTAFELSEPIVIESMYDDATTTTTIVPITDVHSPMSETHRNASLLSVNSGTSACGSSGSSCSNNISSTSTITAANGPMISLSKSETNIFESDNSSNRMSVFSVVSLNDLNECDPFLNRPMNDLSKIQCLNQISANNLVSTTNNDKLCAHSYGSVDAASADVTPTKGATMVNHSRSIVVTCDKLKTTIDNARPSDEDCYVDDFESDADDEHEDAVAADAGARNDES